MESLTLIVTALTFGATQFSTGALNEMGKDAYISLKESVQKRFEGNEKAKAALEEHAADPETYEKPLIKALEQSGADQDESIVQQAQAVMKAADPSGTAHGKYNITVSGGQGVQVGDGNTQTNNFGSHN